MHVERNQATATATTILLDERERERERKKVQKLFESPLNVGAMRARDCNLLLEGRDSTIWMRCIQNESDVISIEIFILTTWLPILSSFLIPFAFFSHSSTHTHVIPYVSILNCVFASAFEVFVCITRFIFSFLCSDVEKMRSRHERICNEIHVYCWICSVVLLIFFSSTSSSLSSS